ncbi:MAG: universal stress protein [Pararhodobacter sp.]|nr:universal stress protein [Pararhodobacter sp.]
MTRPSVIAATDLTPRSAHVIGRAAAMARLLDARLIVAHAQPAAAATDPAPEKKTNGINALSEIGRKLVRRAPVADTLRGPDEIKAEARALDPQAVLHMLQGAPETALAALAERESAALVVLGLHRERRVLDALRLTTMERIVQGLGAPVLIAVQPPARPYRTVLALTDYSPGSAAALAMAARLAPGASFRALHMLTLPLGVRFSPDDPACDAEITRAEQARDGFLTTQGLPELAEPPLMVPGNLHTLLQLYGDELSVDLLCIGQNSGRDSFRLGHYARDLMRAPPVDLLIGRAADA